MTDFFTVIFSVGTLMLIGAYIADQEHDTKQRKMKEDFAAHCAYLCQQHAKEKEELAEEKQELEDHLQAAHERIEGLLTDLEQAEEELEAARNERTRAKEETTFLGVVLLMTVGLGVFFVFLAQIQNSTRAIAAGV
jgi:ferric-dicitrate binding protein FerR (iron transport regulator)